MNITYYREPPQFYTAKTGYPPYNIEQLGASHYRIVIAVAGFKSADLSIHMEAEKIVITGNAAHTNPNVVYLHKGIATRHFRRTFWLSHDVGVDGAEYDSGLLYINLSTRVNLENMIEIPINTKSNELNNTHVALLPDYTPVIRCD